MNKFQKYLLYGKVSSQMACTLIPEDPYEKKNFTNTLKNSEFWSNFDHYRYDQLPNYCVSMIRQTYVSNTCRLNTSNFTRVELYLNVPIELQENQPIRMHKDDPPNQENIMFCFLIGEYIDELINDYINSLSHALWKVKGGSPGKEPIPKNSPYEIPYYERYGEIKKLTPELGECDSVEDYTKRCLSKYRFPSVIDLTQFNDWFFRVDPKRKPIHSLLKSFHYMILNEDETFKIHSSGRSIPGLRAIGIFNVALIEDNILDHDDLINMELCSNYLRQPVRIHRRINTLFGVKDDEDGDPEVFFNEGDPPLKVLNNYYDHYRYHFHKLFG